MNNQVKRIVAIGGGHCNCQVLKMLKHLVSQQKEGAPISLTLVTESASSYYSGMLPGTVSTLYNDTDLRVELEPLAKWCKATYI